MTRFESAEVDFGVAALVLGDGEEVVARNVYADIVEPAIEAVAEGIAQGCGCELEVRTVFEVAVGGIVSQTVGCKLFVHNGSEHILALRDRTYVGEICAGFVEDLLAEYAGEEEVEVPVLI